MYTNLISICTGGTQFVTMTTAETPQGLPDQLSRRHKDPRTRALDMFMHHALASETPSKADVFFVMPVPSGVPVAVSCANRTPILT